eukprot:455796_1
MSLDSSTEHVFGLDNPDFSDRVLVLAERGDGSGLKTNVHVSRMLLSARSQYFRSLFGKPFAEKDSEEIEISLEEGDTDFMMDLLRFVYSMMCNEKLQSAQILKKSTDELVRIIILADRFLFTDVICECIEVICSRSLSVGNCRDLCGIMENRKHDTLKQKISSTMEGIFEMYETKIDHPLITGLSFELFRCTISSDRAKLYSENSVWAAILHWIRKNKPSEEQHLQLLECLRLDHMDSGYILSFVLPSSIWRHTPGLAAKVCLALRRQAVTITVKKQCFEYPSKQNRSEKDATTIKIKFKSSAKDLSGREPMQIDSPVFEAGPRSPTPTDSLIKIEPHA